MKKESVNREESIQIDTTKEDILKMDNNCPPNPGEGLDENLNYSIMNQL